MCDRSREIIPQLRRKIKLLEIELGIYKKNVHVCMNDRSCTNAGVAPKRGCFLISGFVLLVTIIWLFYILFG